jgi:hypothetical protein
VFSGHSIGMQLFGPTSVLARPARTSSYQPRNTREFGQPEFLTVVSCHSELIAEINSLSA